MTRYSVNPFVFDLMIPSGRLHPSQYVNGSIAKSLDGAENGWTLKVETFRKDTSISSRQIPPNITPPLNLLSPPTSGMLHVWSWC